MVRLRPTCPLELHIFCASSIRGDWSAPAASTTTSATAVMPPEFKNVLTTSQQAAFDALTALGNLQTHPRDPESLRRMAVFYYDQYTALAGVDPSTALASAYQSIRYTDRYLIVSPNDSDAKVDEAALLFYTGQADKAIQLVSNVLKTDKNHVKGNFNLGIFLWQSSRHDYAGAAAQFEKVISLTGNDPRAADVLLSAQQALAQLKRDAAAAGHPLPSTLTTTGVTAK